MHTFGPEGVHTYMHTFGPEGLEELSVYMYNRSQRVKIGIFNPSSAVFLLSYFLVYI